MKNLLFYYCLVLTILLTIGSAFGAQTNSVIPLILILPITVYFLSLLLVKINRFRLSFPFQKLLSILALYYGFIVVTIMTISGLVGAKNTPQLISGVIFLPLAGYFILRVLPKRKRAINIPAIVLEPGKLKQLKKQAKHKDAPVVELKKEPATKLPRMNEFSSSKIDVDKRQFLKLIGSAGLSLFLFSIFAKKAEAAFFGSVPGPGTVAVKDTSGAQIDPAIKQPTDGYKITQIDDSGPNFYGFIHKDGAWFIMKEDSNGDYRYTKGSSDFNNATTGWPNRVDLTYGYFDTVF